ncbi:toll/interleukin-1 receptor domain-containing protein [Algoriphagus lacus]|uniref:Toll/interleukin-1 receptor domain-containing protein n=1 Tax=Algoriphagus lacus TaxID=2056311 RepID=A0A418PRA5_9BACT|nr:toll/interleukin-1 receptor domain-containing protein [Algoriphagus lacus]RIW15105.1 toll/interleukin-1 receptor domain-containing protein [Algoriphagus lacus]
MAKGKIFISYRREDTSGESGRLKDKLEQVFGQENIFYDVETLEVGLNFDQSIAKALDESKVLLAMIGPHWLKVTDSEGKPRILKSQDWVRKEISLALQKNLRVIPILVNGATMPDSKDLPDELQELSLKHAKEISSSRWNYDVSELVKVLEKIIDKKEEPKPQPVPEPRTNPRPYVPLPQQKSWWAKNYLWVLGSVLFFAVIVGMCVPNEEVSNDTEQPTSMTEEEMIQARENSPEGSEISESLTLSDPSTSSSTNQETEGIPDLNGYWILKDPQGNQSTLFFSQNGNQFEFVEYNILNVQIGQGQGKIEGNQLDSEYYNSLFEVSGSISLSTGNNGRTWEGQVSIPAAGTSSQISLTRN